jgi:hypothetical protein
MLGRQESSHHLVIQSYHQFLQSRSHNPKASSVPCDIVTFPGAQHSRGRLGMQLAANQHPRRELTKIRMRYRTAQHLNTVQSRARALIRALQPQIPTFPFSQNGFPVPGSSVSVIGRRCRLCLQYSTRVDRRLQPYEISSPEVQRGLDSVRLSSNHRGREGYRGCEGYSWWSYNERGRCRDNKNIGWPHV